MTTGFLLFAAGLALLIVVLAAVGVDIIRIERQRLAVAGAKPATHLDGSLRSWAQACIDDRELKWDKEARRWRRELPRCEPTEEVCP